MRKDFNGRKICAPIRFSSTSRRKGIAQNPWVNLRYRNPITIIRNGQVIVQNHHLGFLYMKILMERFIYIFNIRTGMPLELACKNLTHLIPLSNSLNISSTWCKFLLMKYIPQFPYNKKQIKSIGRSYSKF
jgi:hypothetical protein